MKASVNPAALPANRRSYTISAQIGSDNLVKGVPTVSARVGEFGVTVRRGFIEPPEGERVFAYGKLACEVRLRCQYRFDCHVITSSGF